MKIQTVNYTHGGIALEVVGETEVETMILNQIWEHGEMTRGKGSSIAPRGFVQGFFLQPEKTTKSEDKA